VVQEISVFDDILEQHHL